MAVWGGLEWFGGGLGCFNGPLKSGSGVRLFFFSQRNLFGANLAI